MFKPKFNKEAAIIEVPEVVPEVIIAVSDSDISKMTRGEIRYAIRRMIAGNPDRTQLSIYEYYKPRLSQFGFSTHEFATHAGWDISKKDNRDIVSGHIVREYIKELEASLFDSSGNIK